MEICFIDANFNHGCLKIPEGLMRMLWIFSFQISAQESRRKKKEYMDALEKKYVV